MNLRGLSMSERFWRQVDKEGPAHPRLGTRCWLWLGRKSGPMGYGVFTTKKPKRVQAHRAAFFFVHGRWPEPCALHHCDNPPCVNPEHLYEGNRTQNAEDRTRRGRHRAGHLFGEKHGRAKLTNEVVAELRVRYLTGERMRALAQEKGVSVSTVSRAVRGETKFMVKVSALPRARLGEATQGERNGTAVLRVEQARAIFTRASAGEAPRRLAEEFGVSEANIRAIRWQKTWKHATEGL